MNERHCLTPGCDHVPRSRGLCQSCYNVASKLVWGGRTSWEKLIAEGKALPRATGAPARAKGELTDHFLGDETPPS